MSPCTARLRFNRKETNEMKTLLAATLLTCTGMAWAETPSIQADIWVDNWYAVYANGEPVMQDPVSITTERSFNAGTATFHVELPAVIAIEAKDFKENDSGLEYIGTRRQQMGDGGLIAQFRDAATGEILAVSDAGTRCLVIHHAPLDTACAAEQQPIAGEGACAFDAMDAPEQWTSIDFDDAQWPNATVHTAADVSPKGGYDQIEWDSTASLIWGPSLKQDNTLLCRLKIEG